MLPDRLFGLRFVDPCLVGISPAVVGSVPGELARSENIMPVGSTCDALEVAMEDPLNFELIDRLRFCLGREIDVVLATGEAIRCAVLRYYGAGEMTG